jgi:hypothetical protein
MHVYSVYMYVLNVHVCNYLLCKLMHALDIHIIAYGQFKWLLTSSKESNLIIHRYAGQKVQRHTQAMVQ